MGLFDGWKMPDIGQGVEEFRAPGLAEDKETPLFGYCYSGARSGQAVHVLRRMGYANVKNIGGIAAWTGEVEC